jgi:hypothetical protein
MAIAAYMQHAFQEPIIDSIALGGVGNAPMDSLVASLGGASACSRFCRAAVMAGGSVPICIHTQSHMVPHDTMIADLGLRAHPHSFRCRISHTQHATFMKANERLSSGSSSHE